MNIKTSNEKCPICGKPIEYAFILNNSVPYRIECSCVQEKKQKEAQKKVALGIEIAHSCMREMCGLKARQRNAFIDNITPKSGQEKAYEAAKMFILNYLQDNHTKGLILSGGVGSGKTFFASAIANAIIDVQVVHDKIAEEAAERNTYTGYIPLYFTSYIELIEKLRSTYDKNYTEINAHYTIEQIKRKPLIILDDIGTEKESEWTQNIMYEIIDHRYNESLPIIVTTNATPEALIKKIGSRCFDRLREMCIAVPVTACSQRITASSQQ